MNQSVSSVSVSLIVTTHFSKNSTHWFSIKYSRARMWPPARAYARFSYE